MSWEAKPSLAERLVRNLTERCDYLSSAYRKRFLLVLVIATYAFPLTAHAHGEEVFYSIFWTAFFLIEGVTFLCALFFAPKGIARIVVPVVALLASGLLAAFARIETESGLVWPGLFVPGALALATALLLRPPRQS